ncbi:hypothetical protein DFH94DRAFT_96718, partial [Russula ochroleuca]
MRQSRRSPDATKSGMSRGQIKVTRLREPSRLLRIHTHTPLPTMPPKADWEKYTKKIDQKDEKIIPLDESDIQILKTYGQGPYAAQLKKTEVDIRDVQKRINEKLGIKESDTGLASPNLWDLPSDRQRMNAEHPLQVARCTKIIKMDEAAAEAARAVNPMGAMQGQMG